MPSVPDEHGGKSDYAGEREGERPAEDPSGAAALAETSRKIQQEFEHLRKRYWRQRFWQRGYFSTTSGNITDDIIMRYFDRLTHKDGFSPNE